MFKDLCIYQTPNKWHCWGALWELHRAGQKINKLIFYIDTFMSLTWMQFTLLCSASRKQPYARTLKPDMTKALAFSRLLGVCYQTICQLCKIIMLHLSTMWQSHSTHSNLKQQRWRVTDTYFPLWAYHGCMCFLLEAFEYNKPIYSLDCC